MNQGMLWRESDCEELVGSYSREIVLVQFLKLNGAKVAHF